MSAPRISVIIATHNRPDRLRRLVSNLATQDFDEDGFEVIVVDDGSTEPMAPLLDGALRPKRLRVVRREQGGPGAARHTGALMALGTVLIFVDDDMQLPPGFIAAHAAIHRPRTGSVVGLGNILPVENLDELPLFERFHAQQLERFRSAAVAGSITLRGVHLCTGNVSMRWADYLSVGGFDATLRRSEDRELGIRLEQAGCRFTFAEGARSYHDSDHTDLSIWLRRASLYGEYDLRIARMHRDVKEIHPWRFWSLVRPLSRPLLALAMVFPPLGKLMARGTYAFAQLCDAARLARPALTLTALTYGLQYFRGMREACGSLLDTYVEVVDSRFGAERSGRRNLIGGWRAMRQAIRADHDASRRQRLKYHADAVAPERIRGDLVKKIGFQMLAWYRVMRWGVECRIPGLPQVISRLLRHFYGAEIHWNAQLAPGISLVHGVGLVLSHGAVVAEGCILFQNVTLGESRDPETGAIGAPRLGRDVHVGPGATLLGPIVIGDGSKVMAGVVLTRSVPSGSLVGAPEPAVRPRASVVEVQLLTA